MTNRTPYIEKPRGIKANSAGLFARRNMTDKEYMRRAIRLARKGLGRTNPNPMVGAVIVKDGRIIGEGFHHRYGGLHAERDALRNCTENPAGAVMYVTLEPCGHSGRQPPCAEAVAEAKIAEVVSGSADPNPLVSGRGLAFLRERGVKVTEGFLKNECDALNPVFFHYITTRTPYVALKYAATADGKICSRTGKSKWITGSRSRARVHRLRSQYAAVLVGINTVTADDPMLNCRIRGGRNPVRVICDSALRIPEESRILRTASEIRTIVATAELSAAAEAKRRRIEALGAEVVAAPSDSGNVSLRLLMKILGEKEIDSVLIEGGSEINAAALESGVVNHVYAFIAPEIFGGVAAKTPVGGLGADDPADCVRLRLTKSRRFDQDMLLEYDVLPARDA